MKTLRLFVNNDLNSPISWAMVDDINAPESGSSTFDELTLINEFQDVTLEIYLSTDCCSIFKVNVQGISSKKMTEELLLGLIEERIIDEIDNVKAITLRVEDEVAYVAIFNHEFYNTLIQKLNSLDKPIRFIQSFAFNIPFEEGSWTLFLGEHQKFLRISEYEYYSLDDSKPLPMLLSELLATKKPSTLLISVETNSGYNIEEISKQFDIKCIDITNKYKYGDMVWNFYIQKNTTFHVKLDEVSKSSVRRLVKTTRLLIIFLISFWILDITILAIDSYRIKSQIRNNLKDVVATTTVSKVIIQTASDKIASMRHRRRIYDDKDAIVLLTKFLQIVSTITPNDIKQIEYSKNELQIILGDNFNTKDFSHYRDILETKRVIAIIEDYKSYNKRNKKASNDEANNLFPDTSEIVDDAAWVVKLKPSLWHDAIRNE